MTETREAKIKRLTAAGRKGGKNSSSRPFRDPEIARKAVQKRWAKYYETHPKKI